FFSKKIGESGLKIYCCLFFGFKQLFALFSCKLNEFESLPDELPTHKAGLDSCIKIIENFNSRLECKAGFFHCIKFDVRIGFVSNDRKSFNSNRSVAPI